MFDIMLKKVIFCVFILSCLSSVRAMEEGLMDTPSQYLTILQKAYQGDPKSIDGLHNALRKLKESSHPDDYKEKLRELSQQALNPDVLPEEFAGYIRMFIEHEKHRICPSPLIAYDDNFHQTLWTSLTAEERQKIQEAAQGQ